MGKVPSRLILVLAIPIAVSYRSIYPVRPFQHSMQPWRPWPSQRLTHPGGMEDFSNNMSSLQRMSNLVACEVGGCY